jgi:prolyl-tRNA synthetase
MSREDFLAGPPGLLAEIQQGLYDEAKARLESNIRTDITNFADMAAFFGAAGADEEEATAFRGWVRAPWARPTGDELEAIEQKLKALRLTLRNAPMDQPATFGPCLFTGRPGVEEILIGRAY